MEFYWYVNRIPGQAPSQVAVDQHKNDSIFLFILNKKIP